MPIPMPLQIAVRLLNDRPYMQKRIAGFRGGISLDFVIFEHSTQTRRSTNPKIIATIR
jgi:hypothetical protein